ncbi:hypothetical protein Agabi119p4_2159 [Agaricus bisporus var. burnettii]|uniref:F-box domain-containing protein n=1 Tax=Agaricus bisporus var. burnettii TaxID=192524 RepID=A0A8H7F8P6_AGABI|nr:hypothetical protein Agabi119p4_2159 [Agaricus bisporus var. burnettii]
MTTRLPEKPCITSLPIEIIWRIFMQLDYPSLLAIKQICKVFHSITNTRQFWHDYVKKLCEDYEMTPPKEEIEEYNEMELERWALQ